MRDSSKRVVCAAALVILALASGCSLPKPYAGMFVGERATLITAVPPLIQDKLFSCGPTCVAAVAGYWEKDSSVLFAHAEGLNEDQTADELKRLAERLGMRGFAYRGSFPDLEDNLRKGRPVIVLIPKPKYSEGIRISLNGVPLAWVAEQFSRPRSHWVIAIGFTEPKVIVHDPSVGRVAINRSQFEAWWASKRFTSLLLVPKPAS